MLRAGVDASRASRARLSAHPMPCPHSATHEPCPQCSATLGQEGATVLEPELGRAEATPPQKLLFGDRVGRYVIQSLVGKGGMGLVYTARDPDLDRIVAIKLLPTDAS